MCFNAHRDLKDVLLHIHTKHVYNSGVRSLSCNTTKPYEANYLPVATYQLGRIVRVFI